MGVARVTSKNQITIPADVRDAFNVHPGDELAFFIKLDGSLGVRVRKIRIGSGFGMLSEGTRERASADLRADVADAVAQGVADELR